MLKWPIFLNSAIVSQKCYISKRHVYIMYSINYTYGTVHFQLSTLCVMCIKRVQLRCVMTYSFVTRSGELFVARFYPW